MVVAKNKIIFENILICVAYILTAKLGQVFAIPPGNITPVWIPSGIILAFVLLRGTYLWPGIFLGAFIGNVSAYLDLSSLEMILIQVFTGSANGFGDVLCSVGMVLLTKKHLDIDTILDDFNSFWFFVIAFAIIGPFLSALFGVTSLALAGLTSWHEYLSTFVTWWVGDAVGVLLFAPLLLFTFKPHHKQQLKSRKLELFTFIVTFFAFSIMMWFTEFWSVFLPNPLFFLAPVLLWCALRFGLHLSFYFLLLMAVNAILTVTLQGGAFFNPSQTYTIIAMQCYLAVIAASVLAVGVVSYERACLYEKLKFKYDHDLLTGVYTRGFFISVVNAELQRFSRYGTNFCVVMFDLDHFKKINDEFGHAVGDAVLKTVCELVQAELRNSDCLARYGGEEFLILLPNTDLDGAYQLAERCREKVSAHDFGIERQVSLSIGVAEIKDKAFSFDDLIKKVDDALYISKNLGRNQTTQA
jgi:diguanylate cyclase (GGDEF)-like protein